jgi:hypothetical protein
MNARSGIRRAEAKCRKRWSGAVGGGRRMVHLHAAQTDGHDRRKAPMAARRKPVSQPLCIAQARLCNIGPIILVPEARGYA